MKLPGLIHLTCKDKHDITNPVWRDCLSKYYEMYSTKYEIRVHDNLDIYSTVEAHFPEYLEKIKQITVGAVLADIFRYLILYLDGGIYSDLDCEPLKHVDPLLADKFTYFIGNGNEECGNIRHLDVGRASTILGYEFNEDWIKNPYFLNDVTCCYKNVSICQWFMMSEPKQPIFLKMFMHCMNNIDRLISLTPNSCNYHHGVLSTCGPLAFTKMVLDNVDVNAGNLLILPSDFFCCGSFNNSVPLTKNSFVKHHFTSSWR